MWAKVGLFCPQKGPLILTPNFFGGLDPDVRSARREFENLAAI